MKFSTRVRYGLRLCFLVALSGGGVVSLSTLVTQTNLSEKYLEQILSKLKKGGVLESRRGAAGGYSLVTEPKNITLKSILSVLGDDFSITDCAVGECSDDYCPNKRVMKKIYDSVDSILSKTTLQDMIDDYSCSRRVLD